MKNRLLHSPPIKTAFLTTLLLLAFNGMALAQWTQPDASGNINSTNSGYVGIGTTTPAGKLNIVDGTHVSIFTTPGYSGTFSKDGLTVLANPDVGYSSLVLKSQHNSVTDRGLLRLFRNDGVNPQQEMFYVRMDGNVGVGTITPGFKLDVNGTAAFRGGTTFFKQSSGLAGNEGAAVSIGATVNNESTYVLSVYRAGAYTSRLYVNQFGQIILQPNNDFNVGIGVASPTVKLDVSGQINSSGGLCIAGDCKAAWSEVGGSQWSTSGSTVYYSSGNVGIGTSTPVFDANVSKYFTLAATSGFGSIGAGGPAASTGLVVGQYAFVNTSLGTTDKRIATMVGVTDTATNNGLLDFYTANAGVFTAGPRMRINSAGNVGIGTTSPGTKLDVNGIVRAGNADTNVGNHATYGTTYSAFWRQGADYSLLTEGTNSFLNAPSSSGNIYFRAANSDKMTLQGSTGNLGIGTASPSTKLHVVGDVTVTGNISAKYQDIAEWVESTAPVEAATVMVLDPAGSNRVMASAKSYDTRVAGVVSAQPGVTLGERAENKVLVATTGRVKVKVDATAGPINVGDLLVTSDRPGVAMKSQPINVGGVQIHRPGTLIGKALEPLQSGTGEILVLLSLQ